ncbi:MAG: hypothetical protein H7Y43_17300 [Akkermansiaceae bacterium]|nr:hypothetical protein [Verrucomicrobiales bacterium]
MLKLLQEIRGFSDMNRLQHAPKPSALYLVQLRKRMAEAHRPRRRLVIRVELKDAMMFPTPVKITHLTPAAADQRA